MRALIRTALLALATLATAPAWAAPVQTGHIEAELVARETSVQPGGAVMLALRQKIMPGWHTYWRNPGDSGEATKIGWTLPAGWKAGPIVWPAPSPEPTGPLMNYGYTGEVLLPVSLTVPPTAAVGGVAEIKAAVTFLVCSDICVPEDATLTLALPVKAAPPERGPKWGDKIDAVLGALPKADQLQAVYEGDATHLKLAVTGDVLKGADLSGAYFFPYLGTVIDHAARQSIERGPDGLTLSLSPSYDFKQGKPPASLDGVLSVAGQTYEIAAKPGPLPATAAGLGPPPPKVAPVKPPAGGLLGAALFAFMGGLILNLMPCVFPVLSMKAASLARHAHGGARAEGRAFLAGVLVTFLVLGGLLIAARAAGGAVGWGFQLQSPAVVAVLALIMLLTALNLSGLFEIGASAQGIGGGLAAKGGLVGAFFTGALAVVVAAPCTAPFMAPALGFALTQSAPVALAVFAALGLGLAAPFVAVSFAPPLLRLMPRPGAWMDGLRKLLAFPMYAAAAWLVWVLAQQTGSAGLARLLGAGVVIALAAWLFGVLQHRAAEGRKGAPQWALGIVTGALGVAAVAAVALGAYEPPASARAAEVAPTGARIAAEPWSADRVAELRAQGKPVFVDFTAAWCVTCQVNERVALSGAKVADAFAKTGAVYLKADWTNRNAEIAKVLADHGRAGVPLYLVYDVRGGEPVVLPQILTEGTVAGALNKAAKKA